jgi:hypothetical protein
VSENDICNICNELLAHWAEQNKPHLDDEEKCCYVLAVRAVNEIRRLRAEVEALRVIISQCAAAVGAGVSTTCSLEFLSQVPSEIKAAISKILTEK